MNIEAIEVFLDKWFILKNADYIRMVLFVRDYPTIKDFIGFNQKHLLNELFLCDDYITRAGNKSMIVLNGKSHFLAVHKSNE